MIPHSPKDIVHAFLIAAIRLRAPVRAQHAHVLPARFPFYLFDRLAHGGIIRSTLRSNQTAAVGSRPAEKSGRIIELENTVWTTGHISRISVFCQNLNQTYTVTERIEICRNFRHRIKLFLEIFPSVGNLPHDGLAARHQAIGLQIPSTHNPPLSPLHEVLYPFKQFGGIKLYRFV